MTRSRATTRDGGHNEFLTLHMCRIIMALMAAEIAARAEVREWDDPRAWRMSIPHLMVSAWWLVEMALMHPDRWPEQRGAMIRDIVRDRCKKPPGRA
jgi:hypothetical protein